MNGKNIGYIRVSSIDQNTARQLEGVPLDKTFTDTCSGKDTRRPGLMACLDYLREGDTLHVHSIDRLARNLQDLLHLIESLNQRAVAVVFHKEGLTFSGEGRSAFFVGRLPALPPTPVLFRRIVFCHPVPRCLNLFGTIF